MSVITSGDEESLATGSYRYCSNDSGGTFDDSISVIGSIYVHYSLRSTVRCYVASMLDVFEIAAILAALLSAERYYTVTFSR